MNQPARRPTFGELAIRAGWLGDAHINWALSVQQDRKRAGVHLYVGSILVQQRYITIPQALQILKHQRVQIMVDPTTGYRYNVHNYSPQMTYKSPESQATLQPLGNVDSLLVRGDIGLRQVQEGAPETHAAGGAGGWAEPAAPAGGGGNWEDWGGGGGAAPVAAAKPAAGGPVYAELTADEKKSGGDEDYDWYGQTILDDGSLADQLKAAAAEARGGGGGNNPIPAAPNAAAAVAMPAGEVKSTTGVRAKPGTVVFLALPHPGFDDVYRTITDLCAAKGIGTVRIDDVNDTTPIWKGIERFISGSHFMIADFTGSPQASQTVVHEATAAHRAKKPTVAVTSSPTTRAQITQIGINLLGDYNRQDHASLSRAIEPLIDKALGLANLRA